jgi:flagellar hook protein FlgE
MSLLSALTASVSGLQAQANALSAISENISNANTTGFKEATVQFEDALSNVTANDFNAGGVTSVIGTNIAAQGGTESTTSPTDLEIQGNGFFVVQDANGANLLTRAGSFTQNASGTLVNAAGFTLLGEPIPPGATTAAAISGEDQLVPITINPVALIANPSSAGTLSVNLDSDATVVTPTAVGVTPAVTLPSANTAGSAFTSQTSLTTFDNLGNTVNLNVYYTKTGPDTWEMDVYNAADATNGGFPFTTTTGTPPVTTNDTPLTSATLTFNPTTGALASSTVTVPAPTATTPTPATGTIPIQIPNGQTLNLNVGSTTQLASPFALSNNTVNGNAPANFQSLSVSTNGTLSEVYSNGATIPIFTIPLATVASINNLTPVAGDAFQTNEQSGNVVVGAANTGGFGSINSDTLETSTVDLATQLTNMVVAQNSYDANSKVFQTGSDLLQELINIIK